MNSNRKLQQRERWGGRKRERESERESGEAPKGTGNLSRTQSGTTEQRKHCSVFPAVGSFTGRRLGG